MAEPVRGSFGWSKATKAETREREDALIFEARAMSALLSGDETDCFDSEVLLVIDGESDPDGWCRIGAAVVAGRCGLPWNLVFAAVAALVADGRLEFQGDAGLDGVIPVRVSTAGHSFLHRRFVGDEGDA